MDWLHYKKIFITTSVIMLVVSIYSLINWQLKLGLEFTGGTLAEYKFSGDVSTEQLSEEMSSKGIELNTIQKTSDGNYIFKLAPLNTEQKQLLNETLAEVIGEKPEAIRFEVVGPTIGPELVKKTIYAIILAAGVILLWVAYQFKNVKYGAAAILAMFHDSFILIGSFSLLGHFMNAEIDFLFVTALLTTLSFSVHDTIVVFDRIREINKKYGGDLYDVSNRAVTETMVRSLNNSFTIMFMLVALILLGGSTVKWFAVALLVGTVLGTYSSPFVAVPLLAYWDTLFQKLRTLRRKD